MATSIFDTLSSKFSSSGLPTHTQLIGNGSDKAITVTHNLNAQITCQVFDVSSGELVYPDIHLIDSNSLTVTFASAPSTSAYRIIIVGDTT